MPNYHFNLFLLENDKYKPVRLNLFGRISVDLCYVTGEKIKYSTKFNNKKTSYTIYTSFNHGYSKENSANSCKKDNKNMIASFRAHLIHMIDAQICYEVTTRLLKRGISVKSNHDCFYASVQYHTDIKQVFKEVYIEIFANPRKLIDKFIKDNNIILTKEEKITLDTIYSNSIDFSKSTFY